MIRCSKCQRWVTISGGEIHWTAIGVNDHSNQDRLCRTCKRAVKDRLAG